ncbi:DUF3231 family protein [Oceanobacillus rekensis]|uniref:DUF3231 family protein n=1 Tax=Oceanobacillus rekensis TaxID=937927 RepID=UPI000B43B77D|nr:DUF3231 family protein [Oceanobacillus rekensis]
MTEKKIHLTSSEIASLWTAYTNGSMANCILGFMLKDIQDPDIKPAIQHAYDITTNQLEQLLAYFKKENYAVPNGFTEQDVNMNAPWLFTDTFCLTYVNHMSKVGMLTSSGFLSMSYKKELRDYFTKSITETTNLYNQTVEIALEKGINYRHPYIEVPKKSDYVDSKKYLSGLNPFSDKRPLNAIEISHLYTNIMTNVIGVKLCLAFAQTSPNKTVQDYLLRGKEISQKHIKIFVDTLMKENLDATQAADVAISDSTTQTFSDKLIMFHMSVLISAGIGNYAMAGAVSQRSDLMINYERLSIETARLAKSGADIMIDNNWLEQSPGIIDREKLARNKGKS